MLRAFLDRDRRFDGRFVTGVHTTGIYCVASCTAKKPNPENVDFFQHPEAAREAGFRACLRCSPDDVWSGWDPDRELMLGLLERVRKDPAAFPHTAALAGAAGLGTTRLTELVREQLHTTPAALLARERIRGACAALRDGARRPDDAAWAAGYGSLSTFHAGFRRFTGLTPAAYRDLVRGGRAFTLVLPAGYRRQDTFGLLARDPGGPAERVEGDRATRALLAAGEPVLLEMERSGREVRCRVRGPTPPSPDAVLAAHAAAVRLLGLVLDPKPLERRARREPLVARLVEDHRGLRLPLTPTVFEGFCWAVVGQQMSVVFATSLRRSLIELAGTPVMEGWVAPPEPAAVARLGYGELTALRFSGRKAEYLIDAARMVVEGTLSLEALAEGTAPAAEARLLQVRGVGPWSANYVLMRACGFGDCVPVGDAGLTEALRRFHQLDERPGPRATLELMEPFAPHRSLATLHLWRSLSTDAAAPGEERR